MPQAFQASSSLNFISKVSDLFGKVPCDTDKAINHSYQNKSLQSAAQLTRAMYIMRQLLFKYIERSC